MRCELVGHAVEMGVDTAAAFDITILPADQRGYGLYLHGEFAHRRI